MHLPGIYALDRQAIKLNAYRLLCLFYASRQISELSYLERVGEGEPSRLQQEFFAREMTRLLLNIAIGLRVLDDQMRQLPKDDDTRHSYEWRIELVSRPNTFGYRAGLFINEGTLREVCNKIIHATSVEPHLEKVKEAEASPTARVLSGFILLRGSKGGALWQNVLDVSEFVKAIQLLFDDSSWVPVHSH